MAEVDPGLRSFAEEVIDRLLAAGAELFPEGEQAGGLMTPLAGAAAPPGGATAAERLGDAVAQWGQRRSALQRLDEQSAQIVARAAAGAVEGRAAVQRLRERARAQVEAIMPVADTPAGARLLVATLDQALAELQQHVAVSKQVNAAAAAQLRDLATAYQGSV